MTLFAGADERDAAPEGWVEIGRVGRPHGVMGAMHFRLHNVTSDLLVEDLTVGLFLAGKWIERSVSHVGGGGAVTLDLVKGRDNADMLKHAQVFVRRDDFPPLDEDEVYLADLVGAAVSDADGNALGVVESFDDNGAQPLMQVRTPDGRLVDVPFVGPLIVDLSPDEVVLQPPIGLFDDDAADVAGDKPTGPRSPKGRAKQRREKAESETARPDGEETAS